MDKWTRIRAIIVLILGFIALSMGMKAQHVTQKGNTFYAVKTDSSQKSETPTKYKFVAGDGKEYKVYLSKNGKAFIKRVSKSGKEYRQYLPEITKMIQDDKNSH